MGVLRKTAVWGFTLTLVVAMFGVAPWVVAQQTYEYSLDGDIPTHTGFEKGLTKLGRGFSNILFGWAEVPVTFDQKLKAGKSLQYLVGVVPVLGTARALMRTGTGVFEVVSFPFSDRAINYGPVIEPEYLF